MPQIMCPYCLYIGQGDTIIQQWEDVKLHEDGCIDKPKGSHEPFLA